MIVSDGFVWPAFVARAKTVTRRDWAEKTASRFKVGYRFDKYDTAPFNGGVKIGRCNVFVDIYREPLAAMPDSDYEAEGFAWLHEHPQTIPEAARGEIWAEEDCSFRAFNAWRNSGGEVYVVRYKIIYIEPAAIARVEQLLASKPTTLF